MSNMSWAIRGEEHKRAAEQMRDEEQKRAAEQIRDEEQTTSDGGKKIHNVRRMTRGSLR